MLLQPCFCHQTKWASAAESQKLVMWLPFHLTWVLLAWSSSQVLRVDHQLPQLLSLCTHHLSDLHVPRSNFKVGEEIMEILKCGGRKTKGPFNVKENEECPFNCD